MFRRYKIAGLTVDIDFFNNIFEKQSKSYAFDCSGEPDIKIKVPIEFLTEQNKKAPLLTLDDIEYIWTGFDFYRKILKFGEFMIHSSAVMYGGYAYLFSANCGTGKSTHTSFWQKNFGEDKAQIINDDKPVIKKINGKYYVYGTPWSGKSDKNLNVCVPLAGLAILERAESNSIERITPGDAFKELYYQTHRPNDPATVDLLLDMFNDFLPNVNLYKLHCNMSNNAAQVAYEGMKLNAEN